MQAMATRTPQQPWMLRRSGAQVRATFRGFLDARSGQVSAAELERALEDLDQAHLYLDVGAMDGYANEARQAWGKVLQRHHRRICTLTTSGATPIVRLGASLLGMLARVEVKHL